MGSMSTQLPPCSSATSNRQWMLLAPYAGGIEEGCNITGDPNTIAAAATSNGLPITVSLRREPSPALSRICLRFLPGTGRNRQAAYSTVVATHGGSVLLAITSTEGYKKPCGSDYFVYSNFAAADEARPPSLYLLPRYISSTNKEWRRLDASATGMLCHGEAEFVVAELQIARSSATAVASPTAFEFELRLFRHGEWCVRRPQIIGDDDHGGIDDDGYMLGPWAPRAIVALGDGLLCWVDHRYRGVIFSDVLAESPELRYVAYPDELVNKRCFLCTNAPGALKLVRLSPGRCSYCSCSQHGTAVSAWTLKTDDMAWVLETETVADSNELWALEAMNGVGYARVHLVYPVASMKGRGHHAPSEEVEHMAGKGFSHKGN